MSRDELAHGEVEQTTSSQGIAFNGVDAKCGVCLGIARAGFDLPCVALEYFVAERLPELTEDKLRAAMTLWQKAGPASYDMDIELRGARPGQVHVEVRDKEVEARNSRWTHAWSLDVGHVVRAWAVDTLSLDLDIAQDPERQIQANAGTTWHPRCEFDPKFGYPAVYHRLVSGGPEVYWRVTAFQPK